MPILNTNLHKTAETPPVSKGGNTKPEKCSQRRLKAAHLRVQLLQDIHQSHTLLQLQVQQLLVRLTQR